MSLNIPSPVQRLSSNILNNKKIAFYIKREDLIHTDLGGNKWRKLKYNLIYAKQNNFTTLLTFGGAYANHIYAVAAAGKLLGFKTIGIIRGERATKLNETLSFAESQGMQLVFVSRTEYRNKTDAQFVETLKERYGRFYLIPEGGSNALAVRGVKEMIPELNQQLSEQKTICCACGTGGTLAGLIEGVIDINTTDSLLGFPVLKNATWMETEVKRFLTHQSLGNWSLNLDYHFGGYAKIDKSLINFICQFKSDYNIQLEPTYTGKLLFGLFDLIDKDYFKKGSTVVAIHSGGLQGLNGYREFNEKLQ